MTVTMNFFALANGEKCRLNSFAAKKLALKNYATSKKRSN